MTERDSTLIALKALPLSLSVTSLSVKVGG